MKGDPILTVVGPVYNEKDSLPLFHERLTRTLRGLDLAFEIIYVDDGSRDGSAEYLRRLVEKEPSVKVIHFSRNFGHQLAITAGMDHASGQACVVMDTDGQDPPELIGAMVEAWRKGSEVVYAVRTTRQGESLFKRATAAIFYRLMRRMTQVDIPLDAGDFRLLDRKVLDAMQRMRETNRFMRALTSWVGFRQTPIEYARQPRLGGETHYPFLSMLSFAMDGITSFSRKPLRWVSLCGLSCCALSIALWFWVLYIKIFNPEAVQGWTSMMGIMLLLGGIQLLAIGIIGEYIGRIFDEVKQRPLYIVREFSGLAPDPPGDERLH